MEFVLNRKSEVQVGDYSTIRIITKPAEDGWQVPRSCGTQSGMTEMKQRTGCGERREGGSVAQV
jgi:hypothetical protein